MVSPAKNADSLRLGTLRAWQVRHPEARGILSPCLIRDGRAGNKSDPRASPYEDWAMWLMTTTEATLWTALVAVMVTLGMGWL